ncbi:MAG TPA: potassium transporter TrkG [Kiritimatiellia bacterium]|nr:potassium transporter TrkG [Kiritimatiellia bacterium]HMP35279.1 potassium transporter TrkG [Kiritimatiellia bacterium]
MRFITLGYLGYALAAWLLLCLPWAQTVPTPWIDHLFTSVSALSTTGLTTVSISGSYTWFGEVIILLLIQIGGIGYMTFGSFIVFHRYGFLPDRRLDIAMSVLPVPAGLRIEHLVRGVVHFTAVIEILGAIALYAAFRRIGVEDAAWSAVFHSISAFCTAGFSLYDTSMEVFRQDAWVNTILAVLSYLGAIGFIVCVDLTRRLTGKSRQITLTTRIIVGSTLLLSLAGIVLFYALEPSIQALPPRDRALASMFQIMSALTTVGFNSIQISMLSQASLFLLILLMVVGASPSGTGGGLKTTTFSALIGVMRSAVKGMERVYFWGKEIPPSRVLLAMASLGFYAGALIIGCYLLAIAENHEFEALLFEASSALGTVGLSTGITSLLTDSGKTIIIFLMFIGRVGPLAFGLAFFHDRKHRELKEQEDLVV